MATEAEKQLHNETYELNNRIHSIATFYGKNSPNEEELLRLHEASKRTWYRIVNALGPESEQLKDLPECSKIIKNLHAKAEKLLK